LASCVFELWLQRVYKIGSSGHLDEASSNVIRRFEFNSNFNLNTDRMVVTAAPESIVNLKGSAQLLTPRTRFPACTNV
jgi:hypothetical protein